MWLVKICDALNDTVLHFRKRVIPVLYFQRSVKIIEWNFLEFTAILFEEISKTKSANNDINRKKNF